MKIAAILVAAGSSSRMKGTNKLLQTIQKDASLIQHIFKNISLANVDQIIVVTGRDHEQIKKELSQVKVNSSKYAFIHNPNYMKGMTSSIQAGILAIEETDAIMVCLGDMPLLTTGDYNNLINFFKKHGTARNILAPYRRLQKGNPVIFGSAFFQEIVENKEMEGCYNIIAQHIEMLIRKPVEKDSFFFDLDVPQDFIKYKNKC